MSTSETVLGLGYVVWVLVCMVTALAKGRGLGWIVLAALVPPLYVVLVLLPAKKPSSPPRVRCPDCRLGWVRLDRLPRTCSGCGEEIPLARLQAEIQRDMM